MIATFKTEHEARKATRMLIDQGFNVTVTENVTTKYRNIPGEGLKSSKTVNSWNVEWDQPKCKIYRSCK